MYQHFEQVNFDSFLVMIPYDDLDWPSIDFIIRNILIFITHIKSIYDVKLVFTLQKSIFCCHGNEFSSDASTFRL